MTTAEFAATTQPQDGRVILHLSGDIDRSAQDKLDEAWQEAAAAPGFVVIDFSNVEYINSTGIAIIVGLLSRARAAGRDVRAYGLSPHYREIFEITRLADFMHIYDKESEAVAT